MGARGLTKFYSAALAVEERQLFKTGSTSLPNSRNDASALS
jgi:hypothetical protein